MKKRALALLLTAALLFSLLILPAQAAGTNTVVVRSPQNLTVNGFLVECEKYNIDGYNYFKLRDIAYLLSGTSSQFSVGWDAVSGTVSIVSGGSYSPVGGELEEPDRDNSATAVKSSQTILINGAVNSALSAYNIGGSNFFKLADLGSALGFEVSYDGATNTAVITSADYTGSAGPAALPVLSSPYPVEQHYDPASQMILSSYAGDLPVEISFDIPYITGVPGADAINSQLAALQQAFWADETLAYVMEYAADPIYTDTTYFYVHPGYYETISCGGTEIICVYIPYGWFMGGVNDYGSDCYLFDAVTGLNVDVRAFFPGWSDKQITDSILAILRSDPDADSFINLEGEDDWNICNYGVDDFDFYLEDGGLWVHFDKYELSFGAAGEFDFLIRTLD